MGVATMANKNTLFVTLVGRATQFKAVRLASRQIQQICRAYVLLRCLHVEIGDFSVDNNNRTDYLTPCTCTQGNNAGDCKS